MTTIATKDQFKENFGIKGTDDDSLITRLLAVADSLIYPLLGRPVGSLVAPYSFTQIRDGTGNDRMVLSFYPIVSITSVICTYYGLYGLGQPQQQVIPSTNIMFGSDANQDSRVLYLLGGYYFVKGRKNITVTGTSGYTSMPDALVQVELEIAGKAYYERKRLGETSKQLGGETVSGFWTKGMLESTKQTLQPYRNMFPG